MRVEKRVEQVPGWMTYVMSISGATSDEIARAERILNAAKLAIEDKAPLFDGPAPLNTNESDIDNYREDT